MKIYYPKNLDKIAHISKDGRIYQLDSFWKMEAIRKELESAYPVLDIEGTFEPSLFSKFHTPEFVEALIHGTNREELIESCGVFWQPWLPVAMYSRAQATVIALENLLHGDDLSVLILDGGHHTTPYHAYGFGPINSIGIALMNAKEALLDKKIVILDLDVHQGNGFSYIEGDNIAIFDIWNKRLEKWEINTNNPNYFNYEVSDAAAWSQIFANVLDQIVEQAPDILVYYSGADVIATDRMGGIKDYTLDLFKDREEKVFETMAKNSIKVMLSIGGGYVDYGKPDLASERAKLVKTHVYTVESAVRSFSKLKNLHS